MKTEHFKTCPTCGSRIPDPRHRKRVCARCGKVIRRNHKWQFGLDGRAEHRDCENPECQVEQVKQGKQVEMGEMGEHAQAK